MAGVVEPCQNYVELGDISKSFAKYTLNGQIFEEAYTGDIYHLLAQQLLRGTSGKLNTKVLCSHQAGSNLEYSAKIATELPQLTDVDFVEVSDILSIKIYTICHEFYSYCWCYAFSSLLYCSGTITYINELYFSCSSLGEREWRNGFERRGEVQLVIIPTGTVHSIIK